MAVDTLAANTAAKAVERSSLKVCMKYSPQLTADTIATRENKQTKTASTKEAIKTARLRREQAELVKHLNNAMYSVCRTNYTMDSTNSSDNESVGEHDEWLDDIYDYDFKFRQRKGTNLRRTKRKRISSKEQKFIDFCRERQTPENIILERGRKKALRVKFYECTKQMSRDANCRQQNEDRKANIEKRLRKLGIKRLEACRNTSQTSNSNRDDPAAEKFAIREENVPREMNDMLDFLLGLQDRDITPEDYEFLLRLDESVPSKTVSEQRLAALREDEAGDEHLEEVCGICMENYEIGQTRKTLPCKHTFHSYCIDTWLGQSSTKCPLDGQEI